MTSFSGPARFRAAGHPFIYFVNSVDDDGKTRTDNLFDDASSLVAYLRSGGLDIDPELALRHPDVGPAFELREHAFRVFSALAAGKPPQREDSNYLEAVIKGAIQDSAVTVDKHGLRFRPGPMGGLHNRLVLMLIDLMNQPDLDRLRECKRCTHLFLDHGRGLGRRWCSMARCGNRAKAETFRTKQRALRA